MKCLAAMDIDGDKIISLKEFKVFYFKHQKAVILEADLRLSAQNAEAIGKRNNYNTDEAEKLEYENQSYDPDTPRAVKYQFDQLQAAAEARRGGSPSRDDRMEARRQQMAADEAARAKPSNSKGRMEPVAEPSAADLYKQYARDAAAGGRAN